MEINGYKYTEIPLKKFVKLTFDGIRVDFENKLISVVTHEEVKVNGVMEKVEQYFYHKPEKWTASYFNCEGVGKPKSIWVSWNRSETFKTLLKLNPVWLDFDYYYNNSSDYMKKHGIERETLQIIGYKKKKKGEHFEWVPSEVAIDFHPRVKGDYNTASIHAHF